MKRFITGLMAMALATSALFPVMAEGPTAEMILQKAADALGGDAAAKNVKSLILEGTTALPQGMKGNLTIFQKATGKIYVLIEAEGPGVKMEMIQGCDGENCYFNQSMNGNTMLKGLLEGQEKDQLLKDNDFTSSIDWKTLYKSYEFQGTENVEGRKAYKVKTVSNAGIEATNFYDSENFLMVKSMATVTGRMGTMEMTTLFRNYQTYEGGLKIPQKIEVTTMGMPIEMVFENVKINPEIPDSKFALPPDLKN